jgi:hypothetical protein
VESKQRHNRFCFNLLCGLCVDMLAGNVVHSHRRRRMRFSSTR